MQQIENESITSGEVNTDGDLILSQRDGTPINAGQVKGPKGDTPEIPAATTAVRGGVLLADGPTTAAGGNDEKAVTPAGLASLQYDKGRMVTVELGANVDLDQITVPGCYRQAHNAEATTALHYPVPYGGLLEVFGDVDTVGLVWQRYTLLIPQTSTYAAMFVRGFNNNTGSWSAWRSVYNDKWIDVSTFNANWRTLDVSSYGPFRWKLEGNEVVLNGAIETTVTRSGGNSHQIFSSIPSELRPKYNQQVSATLLLGGGGITTPVFVASMVLINPNGQFTWYPGSTAASIAAGTYMFFNARYPID